MKKYFLSMTILAIVVSMSSCGGSSSSFDNDMTNYANVNCKFQLLSSKDQSDENVKKELGVLRQELFDLGNKMAEKYNKGTIEWNAKGKKIMEDIMDKCK